jgi:hypothetical protein
LSTEEETTESSQYVYRYLTADHWLPEVAAESRLGNVTSYNQKGHANSSAEGINAAGPRITHTAPLGYTPDALGSELFYGRNDDTVLLCNVKSPEDEQSQLQYNTHVANGSGHAAQLPHASLSLTGDGSLAQKLEMHNYPNRGGFLQGPVGFHPSKDCFPLDIADSTALQPIGSHMAMAIGHHGKYDGTHLSGFTLPRYLYAVAN